jgi:glycine/D-amino acid oxidase-like deaminating enzyme/nitrite reductase/ring-hydroxylating ferredoxin subunit
MACNDVSLHNLEPKPMNRSGTHSFWSATTELAPRPALDSDLHTNVCVIGGGIAGLTSAYLAAREGKSVVVLEASSPGAGESGRTTAHLTCALDTSYFELEQLHGPERARLAAESHRAAIDEIEEIVSRERIQCDFQRVPGCLFLSPGHSAETLELEWEAAQRAGLQDIQLKNRGPWPLPASPCLLFPRQAQLHPLKYLSGLADAVERYGGRIYSGAHVEQIQAGDQPVAVVRGGLRVQAKAIVVATNSPFSDKVAIHIQQAPYRTYVIGALIPRASLPPALYWDTDHPYHYLRVQPWSPAHDLLLVGGEDHRTGEAHDTEARFDRLEDWARNLFPAIELVEFRWSGQIEQPWDGLGLIGRDPGGGENVFIITGGAGNGLTNATLGALLVRDLIDGRENPWAQVYDPSRKPLRGLSRLAQETLHTAAHYLEYLTPGEAPSPEQIPPGSGAVIRRGLQKIAVYRDAAGALHERSAVCPHLGCIVEWNQTERTWDCPCHGSRFDCYGRVLNGPATRDLAPADDDDE